MSANGQKRTPGGIEGALHLGYARWLRGGLPPCEVHEHRPRYTQHEHINGPENEEPYMQSEFENRAVWQDREAMRSGSYRTHCVSLLIPRNMDTSGFHGSYVVLRGRFHNDPAIVAMGACNFTYLELLDRPALAHSPAHLSEIGATLEPGPLRNTPGQQTSSSSR